MSKSGFSAFYDPSTDKIYNCDEGTITWYHEKRHQKQYHDGIIQQAQAYVFFFFMGSIGCLIADNKYGAFVFLFAAIALIVFYEVDAIIWSFIDYYRRDKTPERKDLLEGSL